MFTGLNISPVKRACVYEYRVNSRVLGDSETDPLPIPEVAALQRLYYDTAAAQLVAQSLIMAEISRPALTNADGGMLWDFWYPALRSHQVRERDLRRAMLLHVPLVAATPAANHSPPAPPLSNRTGEFEKLPVQALRLRTQRHSLKPWATRN